MLIMLSQDILSLQGNWAIILKFQVVAHGSSIKKAGTNATFVTTRYIQFFFGRRTLAELRVTNQVSQQMNNTGQLILYCQTEIQIVCVRYYHTILNLFSRISIVNLDLTRKKGTLLAHHTNHRPTHLKNTALIVKSFLILQMDLT